MIRNIGKIFHLVSGESQAMGYVAILLHIVVCIAIGFFVYAIVHYLKVHKTFEKFLARVKHDIAEQERLKTEEYKRQFEMEGATDDKKSDFYKKITKLLQDSGIKDRIPEMTPIVFVILTILICIAGGILGFFMTQSALLGLVSCGVIAILIRFYIEIQISKNYRQLESESIKFINLLRNNSHIEGSLGEMLGRTIPYLSGGLKVSIEKCYYEIKSSGNVVIALENLCQRTSYRKLREVFEALKMCATHNEDYEQVIDEASASLSAFIEYREEIATLKKNNLIDLLIITAAGLLIIYEMKSMLTDIDVVYYIFHTFIGQVFCIALIVITLLGLYQFIKSDED